MFLTLQLSVTPTGCKNSSITLPGCYSHMLHSLTVTVICYSDCYSSAMRLPTARLDSDNSHHGVGTKLLPMTAPRLSAHISKYVLLDHVHVDFGYISSD